MDKTIVKNEKVYFVYIKNALLLPCFKKKIEFSVPINYVLSQNHLSIFFLKRTQKLKPYVEDFYH